MARSSVIRRGVGLLGALWIMVASSAIAADEQTKQEEQRGVTIGGAEIPDGWLEGTASSRAQRFDGLKVGQAPPELGVSQWKNGEPIELSSLKGKVVLLDFWATWCGPCIASIPHNNELYERYKGDGLVLIGVCHSRGADKMAETAEQKGIKYPVAADRDGQTVAAYAVDSFPDYYFIDRAGRLRILDCKNGNVEDAIKLLLAEPTK